jgi:hypothetical protein
VVPFFRDDGNEEGEERKAEKAPPSLNGRERGRRGWGCDEDEGEGGGKVYEAHVPSLPVKAL